MRFRTVRGVTALQDHLERVSALSPLVAEHAPEAEQCRRLTREVYAALEEAGLFSMLVPRAYGGAEMHPVDAYQVWEAVGRVDPSAAWNLVMNGSLTVMAAWLPEEGADELFRSGPTTVAGALNPSCVALPTEGGWRISGQVPFASGCDQASWFMVAAVEHDCERPRPHPATGRLSPIVCFLPREAATVVDTWHTMGMRGTGSADVRIADAFVPDRLTWRLGPLTNPNPAFDGPAARMAPMLSVHGESIVSVAAAASTIEQLVGLAHRKTPSYTTIPLRAHELVQFQAGRARALVDAAREFLYATSTEGYEEAASGSLLSKGTKVRMQLAACFAAEACAEAGRLVSAAAGSSAIRAELGFEQSFRDLHTLTQHASKSLPRYASAGRLMFGLESDWIVLDF